MLQSKLLSNDSSKSTQSVSSATGSKIDCAKECPCGGPVIPVPDQWLEVMVTGGFKVWHIIFIIIAFLVTMVVVYCCFHRCRIPRTKQEIEADLMRSNLTNKFRDYLQELPNEPTTFVEALKKVQDLEEKMEADDAQMSRDLGARKRLGWLKYKGKEAKEGMKDKEAAESAIKMNGQTSGELISATGEQVAAPNGILPVPETQPNVTSPEGLLKPSEEEKENENEPKPQADSTTLNEPTTKDEATDKKLEGAKEGDGKSTGKHPRRRRHKPNLARTKRAREKSHSELDLEKPLEPNPEEVVMKPAPVEKATTHHRHHHKSRREM